MICLYHGFLCNRKVPYRSFCRTGFRDNKIKSFISDVLLIKLYPVNLRRFLQWRVVLYESHIV